MCMWLGYVSFYITEIMSATVIMSPGKVEFKGRCFSAESLYRRILEDVALAEIYIAPREYVSRDMGMK